MDFIIISMVHICFKKQRMHKNETMHGHLTKEIGTIIIQCRNSMVDIVLQMQKIETKIVYYPFYAKG